MDAHTHCRISKAPRTEKAWGHFIRCPEPAERTRVDVAYIEPNTRSSIHRHRQHWNEFTVIQGELCVWVFASMVAGDNRNGVDPHVLGEGDLLLVPPMVWHQFDAGDGCILLERYWRDDSESPCDDIERLQTS